MKNKYYCNPFKGQCYQKYFKRAIDVISSLLLLVFFLPICLVTAVAIKVNSRGPIFADVPERVGQWGRLFKMYKFRSMIENAHFLLRRDPQFQALFQEYKKSSYKLKNDPRITSVGKFIRKHSIDEVPQIINVLKGDMSLIGPRAYYPDELENQQNKFPHTKKLVKSVLSVKPGISGLWQVSGRSEINFDKRIAIDSKYAHELSLWLDLKIIIKTPLVMFSGEGAV